MDKVIHTLFKFSFSDSPLRLHKSNKPFSHAFTLILYMLLLKCLQLFPPLGQVGGEILFKLGLLRLMLVLDLNLLAFYLKVVCSLLGRKVTSSSQVCCSVTLVLRTKPTLWFRTCLNLSPPMLQLAAAHRGYLRLCLGISYHPVLTASGTDKTLDLCTRADHNETSPKSGEKCDLFKVATTKCKKTKKNQHNKWKRWNECCGTVCFSSFVI